MTSGRTPLSSIVAAGAGDTSGDAAAAVELPQRRRQRMRTRRGRPPRRQQLDHACQSQNDSDLTAFESCCDVDLMDGASRPQWVPLKPHARACGAAALAEVHNTFWRECYPCGTEVCRAASAPPIGREHGGAASAAAVQKFGYFAKGPRPPSRGRSGQPPSPLFAQPANDDAGLATLLHRGSYIDNEWYVRTIAVARAQTNAAWLSAPAAVSSSASSSAVSPCW